MNLWGACEAEQSDTPKSRPAYKTLSRSLMQQNCQHQRVTISGEIQICLDLPTPAAVAGVGFPPAFVCLSVCISVCLSVFSSA